MREDYQESLEKMFPKGFMIVHIKPDNEPQLTWFNPFNDLVFQELSEILTDEGLLEDYNDELN